MTLTQKWEGEWVLTLRLGFHPYLHKPSTGWALKEAKQCVSRKVITSNNICLLEVSDVLGFGLFAVGLIHPFIQVLLGAFFI